MTHQVYPSTPRTNGFREKQRSEFCITFLRLPLHTSIRFAFKGHLCQSVSVSIFRRTLLEYYAEGMQANEVNFMELY